MVCGLPAALGGLGFHRYAGPFSASRNLVSRDRTANFLRNFFSEFRPLISASQSDDIWPSVVIDSSPEAPTREAKAGLEAISATPTDSNNKIDIYVPHKCVLWYLYAVRTTALQRPDTGDAGNKSTSDPVLPLPVEVKRGSPTVGYVTINYHQSGVSPTRSTQAEVGNRFRRTLLVLRERISKQQLILV